MNNEKRIHQENHSKVPENNYELESEAETEYDKGLAETHKQVTDHFFEGTIDQKFK